MTMWPVSGMTGKRISHARLIMHEIGSYDIQMPLYGHIWHRLTHSFMQAHFPGTLRTIYAEEFKNNVVLKLPSEQIYGLEQIFV